MAEQGRAGQTQRALEALVASDYAAVQGFVLAVATLYVLINIAIDILYGIVDVRVRLGG